MTDTKPTRDNRATAGSHLIGAIGWLGIGMVAIVLAIATSAHMSSSVMWTFAPLGVLVAAVSAALVVVSVLMRRIARENTARHEATQHQTAQHANEGVRR